jgi:transcription-repair coupling factor (superfamily II helicase)
MQKKKLTERNLFIKFSKVYVLLGAFIIKITALDISALQQLFDSHKNIPVAEQLLDRYDNLYVKGLHGSAAAMYAAAMFKRKNCCFFYILDDVEEAGYFYHDLSQLLGADNLLFFPSAYKRAIKYGQLDTANEILRTEVLSRMQADDNHLIIVSYADAVAEKVVSRETLKKNTLRITVSEQVDVAFISEVLDSYGFEYTDYVYEPGQYAIRGSIVDVFSFSHEYPYRIDFFGDEVDSIRTFDVENQLSMERLEEIRIIPEIRRTGNLNETLFDLLPPDTVVGVKDYPWIRERLQAIYSDTPILDNPEYEFDIQGKLIDEKTFTKRLFSFKTVQFGAKKHGVPQSVLEFQTGIQPLYHKNFDLVIDSFQKFIDAGYSIYILSDNEKQNSRIKAIFEDKNKNIPFTPVSRTLHDGFFDEYLKICCFTDHQIFDRFHKYNLKSEQARSGKIALSLKELQQFSNGDYVVHIDHGVGRFGGLVRSDMNGKVQEFIKITYSNNDAIFVSIHSLHKISKYRGKDGEAPRINKLGGGAWEKIKEKTKSKVKDIARDLILLYAKRKEEKGFRFSPDSFLQNELEASFIYEDTPDQTKATADVKKDMESERPMDRLICGDVGFGKTEVAIRAAFKAVSDNKQVAILVPTTVLAVQHYLTFKDRLKEFPCTIDYISRARKPADIKMILKNLQERKIDILIGTHRIVGKDIHFADLGLLIIDEEQKFGVSVKEKLKQMKTNVDTLTMTATPIPRTLQFSLMGARDLSTITTPPPNRYPIHTEAHAFDAGIIREAINFEMSRNGQVFLINNRISNIADIEKLVRKEVPDARIAVGHGQMDPVKLEEIISDYINYEYDVLIATSIIESGIDIPNANTIIINNAHSFGLSDLHQLRGRVGRSNKKAFCYLLSPPLHTLHPEARRKLQAIENFSELGSGIHIAMQDLDIRGAGNLLGAEQSGFIADLGYETYQKILHEAVTELKNEEFADLYHTQDGEVKISGENFVNDTLVESDMELFFPATYIPNDSERVSIYRELDNMEDELEIHRFCERLEDRFGKIPAEGKELIRVVRLRRLGKRLGMEKITLKNSRMSIFFVSNNDSPYYRSQAFDKMLSYVQKYPRQCELKEKSGKRSLIVKNIESVEAACIVLEEITNL